MIKKANEMQEQLVKESTDTAKQSKVLDTV